MTCFEIRALSRVGAKACPLSCPHLSGPPQPVPCGEDLSVPIRVRRDAPFQVPGCRRVPFLRNHRVDEYLEP